MTSGRYSNPLSVELSASPARTPDRYYLASCWGDSFIFPVGFIKLPLGVCWCQQPVLGCDGGGGGSEVLSDRSPCLGPSPGLRGPPVQQDNWHGAVSCMPGSAAPTWTLHLWSSFINLQLFLLCGYDQRLFFNMVVSKQLTPLISK